MNKFEENFNIISIVVLSLVIGLFFKFNILGARNIYILSFFIASYLFLLKYVVDNLIMASSTRTIMYLYILIDTILFLLGRFDTTYIGISIGIFVLVLLLLKYSDGIVGVKRGGIVYIIYNLIKIVYIVFFTY